MILLLSNDLATSSKVAIAARGARVDLVTAMSLEAALERCRELRPEAVLLDLVTSWVVPDKIVSELRAACLGPVTLLAFGPHVHESLLEAARAAGCDEVLTCSKFHSTLELLLGRLHRQA